MAKKVPQPNAEPSAPPSAGELDSPAVPVNPPSGPGDAPTEIGGETLESLAGHVEAAAPEPNHEAIARAKEKAGRRGEGQEGRTRGPYKSRKKQSSAEINETGHVSDKPKMTQQEKEDYVKHYQAGVESVEGLVALASQTVGPEWGWRPPTVITLPDGSKVTINERVRAHEVFGKAFAYNKWDGPNPNVSLFMFSAGFIMSRLQMPETRAKAKGFIEKIKALRDRIHEERRRKAAIVTETKLSVESAPAGQ
ncbi:MAG TPA: hypothetical protein VLK33_19800 [Terriglobales bacterium]|nr:hypothetical protein [Terriglobales bacterium]